MTVFWPLHPWDLSLDTEDCLNRLDRRMPNRYFTMAWFPESIMPRNGGWRITVANANVPNMVGQISTLLAQATLNIEDLLNKSLGDLAYTVVDLDGPVPDETLQAIRDIEGVLTLRNLGKPIS